jgi:hypothetical protein
MFVTPNGNLLFAGSEAMGDDSLAVALFQRDENGFWQNSQSVPSPVRGGSAVMYEPGKVMKSGGGSRSVCAQAEGPPLATTAVIDLTEPNMGFEDTGFPMLQRRHFNSLTLLPDGTVLATGGNSCGNGESNTGGNSCFADQNTLLECTEEEPGCIPVTSIPCSVKADCPDWATCGNTGSILDCPGGDCSCNPGNNACYATREAELWDPVSKRWCLMAEESFERMYHSTALLMPDGRVMSSGNGRRQGLTSWETAEFFSPPYLLNGARPEVDAINGIAVPAAIPEVGWGGTVSMTLGAGIAFEDIGRITLVRLGSVTHQNDMDQRFIDLGCFWPGRAAPDGRVVVTANGPVDANQAPPGHYMLFVLTEAGVPSVGHYVKIGE